MMSELEQGLRQARTHHQSGRLQVAKIGYQRVLQQCPQHAEALHLLGIIAYQEGDYPLAETYVQRAITLQPASPTIFNSQGLVRQAQGQVAAAVDSFQHAIRLRPAYAEAQYNLGRAYYALGQLEVAITHFECALHLRPDFAQAHSGLAHALEAQGRHKAAVARYEQALRARPDDAEVHFRLGNVWRTLGHVGEAIASYQQALHLCPAFPEALNNLGNLLRAQGKFDAAIEHFNAALSHAPDFAEAHNNLGYALREQGRSETAVESYERAIMLRPDYAEAHNNLGNALKDLCRLDEALASFERALTLDPNLSDTRWNRAMVWLMQGNLTQGWAAYEWRLPTHGQPSQAFSPPRWDGRSLVGRTILVRAEQGVGDELMFASCIPDLLVQADHCVIECDARLQTLFVRSFPSATIVVKSNRPGHAMPAHLPAADMQIAVGSLPLYVRPNLDRFPAKNAFLRPDKARQRRWAQRLSGLGPGLNIGMAWRSLRSRRGDSHYTRLLDWQALFFIPGINWVNLQYDDAEDELALVQQMWDVTIHAWDDLDLFNDFEEVAALVAELDLVIAPNMTVANVAGSVGQPVWRLTLFGGSWDMLGTKRYPWFPSVRVFCQSQRGEWNRVLTQVADELALLARSERTHDLPSKTRKMQLQTST